MEFHVVSKFDNRTHATFSVDKSTYPEQQQLPPGGVRVQPVVLSLTSNNLSYARLGEMLHWWDTYPVPKAAPAEYNDNTKWGIVPTWGFGIIVESNNSSLRPGTLLFGYWPMASAPVNLTLQESELRGHWVEVSKHREQVMSLYNEYQEKGHYEASTSGQSVNLPEEQLSQMAWTSLFGAVWQTGFLLNRNSFTSDPDTHPAIGPLGNKIPWTKDDADLSQAVLVSLSASGKTARGFAWQVQTKRAQGSGPLAFLQVTQARDAIGDVAFRHANIPSGAFNYSQLDSTVDMAAGFKPRKVVIVDFGARNNALKKFMGVLHEKPELKEAETRIVHVGGEQKVYSSEEALATRGDLQRFGKILCNTADILDEVIASRGKQAYQDDLRSNWEEWISNKERSIPDLGLVWGQGISGESGIHAGWDRVTNGCIAPHESLVYRLG